MSRRTFSATFFWKISFLFWHSDFEQKSCSTFRELLPAIFSELTSMCTEEQIEKTSVLWKIQIFLIISGLWPITQKNFGESGFGKPVKNALYSSRETFWRKQFLKIFIKVTCSWVWAKNVWHDAQTVFCVQWNSVGNLNLLGKINVFLSIPHIMWTFSLTSNETCRVVKLAFIISNGTFWGKSKFNETVLKFSPCFDSEQKTLDRIVSPASSVSTGMFWKKT